jgi:alpha-N-arabinofuranosidase
MRITVLIAALLLSPGVLSGQQETVIEVAADKPAVYTIPRAIFGTFLEPIGNSIYGGLWAQLLENPSFEENLWSVRGIQRKVEEEPTLADSSQLGLPLPWQPLHSQGSRYEPRWGDAANSSRSLLIMGLRNSETGVRQAVYLPAHRTLGYTGSLWLKVAEGRGAVEVSLRRRNRPDEVFARAILEALGDAWARHEFRLDLPSGKLSPREPADFVIALTGQSRVLVDQALLFPRDHVEGMDPEMIALARDLRTPVVRYGGNFTSGYHWRDGVGPMDRRVSMLNQAWGMPEYNHFGTDEFLRFCDLIHAEPQIALNLGSGTPEEAAGWVRYVNERWGNRRGGLLWELGNELWGSFQIGYPALDQVAERTKQFSEAVQAVDPAARIIATGQDPDHFDKWNAAQLEIAPDAYSWLATHFVVGDAVVAADPSAEFRAYAQLALPVGLERRLRLMKEQIDVHPRARNKVRIAFTEWLFHGAGHRVPNFGNMGGALCAAGFLNTLMRTADFVPISNMTGLIEFGGIWKKRGQVYGVPAYWAFRMYSTADAERPVATQARGETYDVENGNRRIPDIVAVPYLDVVSALNRAGDKLTLFCVNRHLVRSIPSVIRISGFAAGPEARSLELRAGSIFQANDEWRPDAVRPRESRTKAGAEFQYLFPAASVTLIEVSR